eukprot:1780915-Prymnesium_polylepis.1
MPRSRAEPPAIDGGGGVGRGESLVATRTDGDGRGESRCSAHKSSPGSGGRVREVCDGIWPSAPAAAAQSGCARRSGGSTRCARSGLHSSCGPNRAWRTSGARRQAARSAAPAAMARAGSR